jgi:hypothetical protein
LCFGKEKIPINLIYDASLRFAGAASVVSTLEVLRIDNAAISSEIVSSLFGGQALNKGDVKYVRRT